MGKLYLSLENEAIDALRCAVGRYVACPPVGNYGGQLILRDLLAYAEDHGLAGEDWFAIGRMVWADCTLPGPRTLQ